ncbi:hypothetical protein ACNOYE_31970 [Nannocystaceae bacterium ST9]
MTHAASRFVFAGFGLSLAAGCSAEIDHVYDREEQLEHTHELELIDRPMLSSKPIEVRLAGYASASSHMLSDEVHGPCKEQFVLTATR